MYEEYFRLTDAPFRLNPDPRFFYGSRSHNKAMAYLHYGLKQAEGFIVITGPVGAGKSMIIGHLLDQLNASNVVAANLLTSNIEPQDLLSQILSAFRVEPEGEGRTGEIEAFEDYLFDQLNRGRRVLLIIDEAQNLPFKTLEELRMLSNIDYEGTPLFQVFLVGQPEFRTIIESDHMEQLRQRVIASYHLENLTVEETRDYILHRLSVAGWQDDPAFSDDAFKYIFEETGGLPRRINTLCNRLMLYCSLEQTHDVTGDIVKLVCDELREEKLAAKKPADPMPPAAKVEHKIEAKASDAEPIVETAAKPSPDPLKAKPAKAGPKSKSKTKPAAPKKTEKIEPASSDDVVVSIDSAREQINKKADDMVPAKTDQPGDAEKPAPDGMEQIMSSSMSVLDRLRAKKAASKNDERQEATLTDVASAIAAASGDENATNGTTTHTTGDNLDMPQWRKALMKSVDETREELKEANASVSKLKSAGSNGARQERRRQIAENLTRADALLNEIREAQE